MERKKSGGSFWRDTVKEFKRNRVAVLGTFFVLFVVISGLVGPFINPYPPLEIDMTNRLAPPSFQHLLGTDNFGRDVLSRIFYGTRLSLVVSVLSVTFSLAIGTSLGAVAGFFGSIIDEGIMRLMDVLFAFPAVLLAITIISILGQGVQNAIIAIGVVYTPIFARITRGSVIGVRGLDYVESARALGAGNTRIITRHVLPNSMAPIVVETTLSLGFAILSESALSFLGLGTQPPTPSLGRMLSEGRMYISGAPWLGVFPGIAILLAVLGFNLIGDGLRDALDPKLKGQGRI
ncbi:ABC transporter permease [Candidatus Bipolaricaulota bacterium]|nr:ABC transporter permease [Candidatus Bipolaricaulota bacterium]